MAKTDFCVDSKDARTLSKVLSAAFASFKEDGDRFSLVMEGVRFRSVTSGAFAYRFEGVQLSVQDGNNHSVFRRVMVKRGSIDLSALRSKFEDLRDMNVAYEKVREEKEEARKEKATTEDALASRLCVSVFNVDRLEDGKEFSVGVVLHGEADAIERVVRAALKAAATDVRIT